MKYRGQGFLEQFDSNFQTHIIEFSKRLTELSKEYEVIIFMARKAACLADCLEEINLSQFHCVITSSRILDMNLDWLQGKKIAIVDDALISGTTIYAALNKLKTKSIENVDVFVLSTDNQWWRDDIVKPIAPFFKLTSDQTSLICSNIVNAISVVPRPYSIDYPLYRSIRILAKDFPDLSNSGDWIVYDSTSSRQDKYDIINLSIVPAEPTYLAFFDSFGLALNHSSLVKIRLYALKVDNVYWCQILPIIILPPLSFSSLEQLFDRVFLQDEVAHLRSWFEECSHEDSLKSKLRVVQYYLACQLGSMWFEDIVKKINRNLVFEQDFKNLNYLFPPPISDSIKHLSKEKIQFGDILLEFEPDPEITVPDHEKADFDVDVSMHKLTKPFLKLFNEKELEARALVHKHGVAVFENEEYKKIINRLNQGFSLTELVRYLVGLPDQVNPSRVLSYFLDLYIDKGAVVPITYIKDGFVLRAFRHGEDVEFSENEIRLCMSMLEKLQKEYGGDSLPHTIVEKALVLFIRIGVQQNFLTVASNPMGDFKSMGIRYYLHGAIVSSYIPTMYQTNFGNSLTNVLLDSGYLKVKRTPGKKRKPYQIASVPTTGVSEVGLAKANQLGLVLGQALRDEQKLSSRELILISTCPYAVDVVGALAAEVNIFQGFYNLEKSKYFGSYAETSYAVLEKFRTTQAFTALNSGSWKFESVQEGTVWKLIKETENIFENDLYREVWKGFWSITGQETSTASNEKLDDLIHRLASWILSTRLFLCLMELSLRTYKEFAASNAQVETNDILSLAKAHLPDVYIEFERATEKAFRKAAEGTLEKEALYGFCKEKIQENYQIGRQLIAEVDVLASSFGKINRTVKCEHSVVIDVKSTSISAELFSKTCNDIFSQCRIAAKDDSTYLFQIPKQYAQIKNGVWLCAVGGNPRRHLLLLCSKLIEKLGDQVELKFTFFFHFKPFALVKSLSSNHFRAPLFWEIAKDLLKKKSRERPGHELVYYTPAEANKPSIENLISSQLPGFINCDGGERTLQITDPYSLTFLSNHFVKEAPEKIINMIDIGIITVLPEELVGVTDYLRENGSYIKRRGSQTERQYYFGKVPHNGSKGLNVVAVRSIDQGNRSVIPAYNDLMDEHNPRIIVLLGIAGAIHKDCAIGDVVIADSVLYYDKRAETENGSKHRLDGFKLYASSMEIIHAFQHENKAESPIFAAAANSPDINFTVRIGPIGTGEAVVKYKDAEERQWLLSVNEKTLALETEAGGFTQQFYEDDLKYSKPAQKLFIVRGISDKADVEKKDEWKLAASKNAMTTLVKLLECVE